MPTMFTMRDVVSAFRRASGGWVNGISSMLTFGSVLLSLSPTLRSWLPKMWVLQAGWFWMIIYAIAVMTFAVNTTKRVLNDLGAKVERDFYSVSRTARRERAHLLLFRLHHQGTQLLENDSASDEAWQQWDQAVRVALITHCSWHIVDHYLYNTKRQDDKMGIPLSSESYRRAVDCLKQDVLDTTIEDVFK